MSAESEELVKKATELRTSERIEEAILVARRATTVDPEDANAWWQLALAVARKDGDATAASHFKRVVELADHYAYGWYRLGRAYKKAGMTDEAVIAWETAVEKDDEQTDAMKELVEIYRTREREGDKEKLFSALKKLDHKNNISAFHLHTLAIAYAQHNEPHAAIGCYKRFLATTDDGHGYFNIGLSYIASSIGQNVDAIDAWRMAKECSPEFDRPQIQLDKWLPVLLALRARVLSLQKNSPLLEEGQWYMNYLNPYQLLNLQEIANTETLEVKEIQRAKKALLQEVELEDGLVEWVPGLRIDRSRALQVADELNDENLRKWHHLVHQDKDLLGFLSRGELTHFLVDEERSPIPIIKELEIEADTFGAWLSPKFASQFDLVFGKALESRQPDYIEAMLDGRRWVQPGDEDKCFESALRQADKILMPLKLTAEKTKASKPTINKVKAALEHGHTEKILSLLPSAFQAVLNDAASLIRDMSIDANNEHQDPDLAKEILGLAKGLAQRAPSVQLRIEKDMQTLDEIIQKEKKDECFLTLSGVSYSFTREGVQFGPQKLTVDEVQTLRWGLTTRRDNSVETQDYTIVIGGPGAKTLSLNWKATSNLQKQRDLFGDAVRAIVNYLMPAVIKKVSAEIHRGGRVQIGEASVSKQGIVLKAQGWFSTKEELCPWGRLDSDIFNGDVVISDKANSKAKVTLPLLRIDNAWVLHWIVKHGL